MARAKMAKLAALVGAVVVTATIAAAAIAQPVPAPSQVTPIVPQMPGTGSDRTTIVYPQTHVSYPRPHVSLHCRRVCAKTRRPSAAAAPHCVRWRRA
jgi:hypothetical protein